MSDQSSVSKLRAQLGGGIPFGKPAAPRPKPAGDAEADSSSPPETPPPSVSPPPAAGGPPRVMCMGMPAGQAELRALLNKKKAAEAASDSSSSSSSIPPPCAPPKVAKPASASGAKSIPPPAAPPKVAKPASAAPAPAASSGAGDAMQISSVGGDKDGVMAHASRPTVARRGRTQGLLNIYLFLVVPFHSPFFLDGLYRIVLASRQGASSPDEAASSVR